MPRLIVGTLVAMGVAVYLTFPRIAGIDTWKWLLGAIGLSLFVLGAATRPEN